MFASSGDGLPPPYGQAPPPPPPPRRSNSNLREASCDSTETLQRSASGSKLGSAARQEGKGRRQRARHNKSTNTTTRSTEPCACTQHLDQLADRLSRMEADTQVSVKALAADVVKLRTEREAAWVQLSELHEHNRLMWQRQRELEEQNSLLSQLLREQSVDHALTASTRLLPQGQRFGGEGLMPRAPLTAMALNQQHQQQTLSLGQQLLLQHQQQGPLMNMPKVPHMGTEIW